MSDQIAVIINRGAGTGCTPEWAQELAAKFRAGAVEPRVTLAGSGAEVIEATRRAINDGARTIVAAGGDGTINAVASKLIGTGTRLGVLPLGTLNHFSKDLRIPQDLDDAVRNVIAGHSEMIDVGEVNGKLFLNNSSIGLYPDMVVRREAEQRRHGIGKWRAFFRAARAVFRIYPFMQVGLTVDGERHDYRTPCVFVGNNEYLMNGLELGERKRMDAGVLSVYIVESRKRTALFTMALRALFGRLRPAGDFQARLATEIVIETRQPRMRVSTDGEVTMVDAPLRYRIRPAELNVIVPNPSATIGRA